MAAMAGSRTSGSARVMKNRAARSRDHDREQPADDENEGRIDKELKRRPREHDQQHRKATDEPFCSELAPLEADAEEHEQRQRENESEIEVLRKRVAEHVRRQAENKTAEKRRPRV